MKKILLIFVAVISLLGLAACEKTDAEKVSAAKENLKIVFTGTDTALSVTSKVGLVSKQDGVSVSWVSNNEDIISDTGVVTRPETEEIVTLTASLTLNEEKDTKTFILTVKKEGEEPGGSVDLALPEIFNNAADGKHVYLSTIGQAGELSTLNTLLSRYVYTAAEAAEYNEKVTMKNLLIASEVGDGSIVILVPGASTKGLGSAGTNLIAEQARANDFKQKAKEGKITLYVVHLGGETRRGAETDPLIKICTDEAKLVLLDVAANSDNFFTLLGKEQIYYYSQAQK